MTVQVLSIDFDFFVDLSHAPDHICDFDLRGPDEKDAPFVGPEFQEFLSHFNFTEAPFLDVHDGHEKILQFMPLDELEIWNIDSHLDICYSSRDVENYPRGEFHCGSWGGFLIAGRTVKRWVQVYPEWRKHNPERIPAFVNDWVKSKGSVIEESSLDSIQNFRPSIVFVCRSSPWVPSAYDGKFSDLCRMICKVGKFDTLGSEFTFSRGVRRVCGIPKISLPNHQRPRDKRQRQNNCNENFAAAVR